ncbi:hypothetical protein PDIDSM_8977 [Penicillium digitatum]|nr:hypothetical protein PDIDSM_8977 [Penicillium digitatum]
MNQHLPSGQSVLQRTVPTVASLDLVTSQVYGQRFKAPGPPKGSCKWSVHRISGEDCRINDRGVYNPQDIEIILESMANKYGAPVHEFEKRSARRSPPGKDDVVLHRSLQPGTGYAALWYQFWTILVGFTNLLMRMSPDERLSSGFVFIVSWTLDEFMIFDHSTRRAMSTIETSRDGDEFLFLQFLLCVNFLQKMTEELLPLS